MIPWWLALMLGLSVGFVVAVGWAEFARGRRSFDVDLVGLKPSADVIVLDWDQEDDRPRLHGVKRVPDREPDETGDAA